MKYLPRSRGRHPYSKKVLFLLGVFVVGAVFFYISKPLWLPIIAPVWKSENVASRTINNFFGSIRSKHALSTENAILKEKVSSLELELSVLRIEGVVENKIADGILAAVLVRPPQSLYDFLVIDRGSDHGVTNGAKAYMPEGPELGLVAEVFNDQSRVRLLTSSGEKTSAVLERHQVPVVIEGVGGGNFYIKVPRETEVEVGDRILSADLDGGLLAVVGSVTLKSTDSFKEVLAKSPASIWTTRLLLIRP